MRLGVYDFQLTAKSRILLGQPFPFVLRSGLGNVIKGLTCVLRSAKCPTCMLKKSCMYAVFFESQPAMTGAPQWLTELPKPYVLSSYSISVEDVEKKYIEPGQTMQFTIKIFGNANQYLPYLIHAIIKLGDIGIGKKIEGEKRGRFKLNNVTSNGNELLDKNGMLKHIETISNLSISQHLNDKDSVLSTLTIKYITPIRLKENSRFTNHLPFHTLFNATLRRIRSLEYAYGEVVDLNCDELFQKAQAVVNRDSTLVWKDLPRYSGRQKTAMQLGGLVGYATYEGENLQDFLPFLRYVEQVHVGKQTAFGLGRVEVLV